MGTNPTDCGVVVIEGSFRYFQHYRPIKKGKHRGWYWVWPAASGSKPHLVRPERIRRFPQPKGQLRLF